MADKLYGLTAAQVQRISRVLQAVEGGIARGVPYRPTGMASRTKLGQNTFAAIEAGGSGVFDWMQSTAEASTEVLVTASALTAHDWFGEGLAQGEKAVLFRPEPSARWYFMRPSATTMPFRNDSGATILRYGALDAAFIITVDGVVTISGQQPAADVPYTQWINVGNNVSVGDIGVASNAAIPTIAIVSGAVVESTPVGCVSTGGVLTPFEGGAFEVVSYDGTGTAWVQRCSIPYVFGVATADINPGVTDGRWYPQWYGRSFPEQPCRFDRMHGNAKISAGKEIACVWRTDVRAWQVVNADCETNPSAISEQIALHE